MLELFTKLNAKTTKFSGSSSTPLLDVSDLCGVLASLSEVHSWYIYAMIDQRKSYNMECLHRYFKQLVLEEMRKRKYKSKLLESLDFAEGVTKAVIYAHFHHKGKCKACNGFGKNGKVKCLKCEGKGNKTYTRTEKINYGFPLRDDLNRKWYEYSCKHYDLLIESELSNIQENLLSAIRRLKKQELQYRREENEELFNDD